MQISYVAELLAKHSPTDTALLEKWIDIIDWSIQGVLDGRLPYSRVNSYAEYITEHGPTRHSSCHTWSNTLMMLISQWTQPRLQLQKHLVVLVIVPA